jgi:hypothetical protein
MSRQTPLSIFLVLTLLMIGADEAVTGPRSAVGQDGADPNPCNANGEGSGENSPCRSDDPCVGPKPSDALFRGGVSGYTMCPPNNDDPLKWSNSWLINRYLGETGVYRPSRYTHGEPDYFPHRLKYAGG